MDEDTKAVAVDGVAVVVEQVRGAVDGRPQDLAARADGVRPGGAGRRVVIEGDVGVAGYEPELDAGALVQASSAQRASCRPSAPSAVMSAVSTPPGAMSKACLPTPFQAQ